MDDHRILTVSIHPSVESESRLRTMYYSLTSRTRLARYAKP
jgi:hypothetical protein